MKIDTITTAMTCKNMMRAKIDLNRMALLAFGDKVSDTANGADFDLGAALGKLFPKAMDIDLDRIRGDLAGQPEDMIFNQFFRDNAVLAPHQELEHRGLTGG